MVDKRTGRVSRLASGVGAATPRRRRNPRASLLTPLKKSIRAPRLPPSPSRPPAPALSLSLSPLSTRPFRWRYVAVEHTLAVLFRSSDSYHVAAPIVSFEREGKTPFPSTATTVDTTVCRTFVRLYLMIFSPFFSQGAVGDAGRARSNSSSIDQSFRRYVPHRHSTLSPHWIITCSGNIADLCETQKMRY